MYDKSLPVYPEDVRDAMLASEFFPVVGGAHSWLYEVYRRWPSPVVGLVRDYRDDEELAPRQISFDDDDHGSLHLQRLDFVSSQWGVLNIQGLRTFLRLRRAVRRWQKNGGKRLHCLKVVPEGVQSLFNQGVEASTIIYAHGEEFLVARSSRELNWLTRVALNRSDLVIANSRSTAKMVEEFSSKAKVEVIHPGVNVAEFENVGLERRQMRQTWNIGEDTVVLVSMARLEPRKNHQAVLQAIFDLGLQKTDLLYVIASDGPERKNLQDFVKSHGLDKVVRFTGYLSNRERAGTFAAADIHIMPSIQTGPMIEGFGIVFLEAAAAGIPSIAGNVGGQAEAVIHNRTGFVLDGRDPEELSRALHTLVVNPELRKKMGEEGRKWARRNDWDLVARKTHEIIESVSGK